MATRKSNRKWLWWGVGILVVALAIGVVFVIKNNVFDKKTQDEQSQTETKKEEKKSSEEKKETKEPSETEPAKQKEEVKQYDGDDPNKAEKLTGVISYAGVSGGYLIVRVNIDQYLGSGSCKLGLVKNGTSVYNKTVDIVSSVSTSTCDGFKVPVSEIPSSGNVLVEVALESDNKYGKMVGEVNV